MAKVFTTLAKVFLESDDGPTAADYALMLTLVIVVVIVSVAALGNKMSTF